MPSWRRFFFLLTFTIIFSSHVHGAPPLPSASKWYRWDLAGIVSSQRLFRGAVFYPYPTVFVGPSLTLFGQLSLRGPQIIWTRQNVQFDLKLISDGDPLIRLHNKFDDKNDYRASRSDALEFSLRYRYNFGPRKLFSLSGHLAQEVHRYKGQYGAVALSIPLYKFLSIKLNTGVGSLAHNRYLYGARAQSGSAHQDVVLKYVVPRLPWPGLIIAEIGESWILQRENRTASLVRGNHQQSRATIRWIWPL